MYTGFLKRTPYVESKVKGFKEFISYKKDKSNDEGSLLAANFTEFEMPENGNIVDLRYTGQYMEIYIVTEKVKDDEFNVDFYRSYGSNSDYHSDIQPIKDVESYRKSFTDKKKAKRYVDELIADTNFVKGIMADLIITYNDDGSRRGINDSRIRYLKQLMFAYDYEHDPTPDKYFGIKKKVADTTKKVVKKKSEKKAGPVTEAALRLDLETEATAEPEYPRAT